MMTFSHNILSVIPIVIPVGAGDAFRSWANEVGLFFDQLSNYVGFNVRIPIKFFLVYLSIYLLVKVLIRSYQN